MILTGHQHRVAAAAVAEEAKRRQHIVVALSGAHAYGFPSPDSDLDIKAVHLAPTSSLLGLPREMPSAERLEVIEGVEIDYSSNELGGVVAGVLAGNGNYIERILGAQILTSAGGHAELSALTTAALSRRVFHHYRGFAASQRRASGSREKTAKRLLYILRTALTGVHLLESGELRVDLTPNASEYGYADALELIEAKRVGENVVIEPALAKDWSRRLDAIFARLDLAKDASSLPVSAPNRDAFEAWLIDFRLASLG